ncbi:protein phosphatase 2C domain-containing protein [Streptomyces sp. N2-109]|uniref:Protein phosphatase 2C domain-containing protein n=1 Tax=Streptomyces gossypii TaxID=2883101 RepID=A0ABT2JV69_9ACTN|nr:protein phosphatase 2C domain-containing protein [Streptomyces gossypii]MCT2591797.1 protein phosphatase 2C domain-containing protein [Streptomyces gossypii]
MRIEMASEPGNPQRPNEDYTSVALPASGDGGTLVVLDGVTPPPDEDGCVHGVPWFTARLGSALLELCTARRDLALADCLAGAVFRTAETHRPTCDLSHPRTPQATVVIARWNDKWVEHLVLSDSTLLLEHWDGSVTPVLDPRLDELPPEVSAMRREVRAMPRGSTERATAGAAYARAVEALRNAPDGDGFYTAAADPAVAARAVTGSTPRPEVSALVGLTDGATRWTETFHTGDWAALAALVRKEGPHALISRVRSSEAADPGCTAFPRGKRHDDATAVLAELAPQGL